MRAGLRLGAAPMPVQPQTLQERRANVIAAQALFDTYPGEASWCEGDGCGRVMLPQSIWWHLRNVGRLPYGVVRLNSDGLCSTCYSRRRRAARRVALGAMALIACLSVAACGSPRQAVGGQSVPASPAPTPTTAAPTTAVTWQSIGVRCPRPPDPKGVACQFKGNAVTISTASWTATAALRHQACQGGYVNQGYTVATNGANLTLAPDSDAVARQLAALLGLRVVRYCA
ncbi:MAG TPA: hypothetical protein VFT75_18375 [Nocardioidaceae bacterium]|nr:hypothetical protein [Nocardioidaceae bacterium]